jgi:DNA-binding transcriptional ArsR family regulator
VAADDRVGAAEDAARILSLLAEPERLRVVAALVLGYTGMADISLVSGVAERAVARAISRLVAGGLVSPEENGYRFASEELKKTARLMAASQEAGA